MANLTTDQINELKDKGVITQVIPSADLADNSVDDLKEYNLVTLTDPSEDIEEASKGGGSIKIDELQIGYLDNGDWVTLSHATEESGEIGSISIDTNARMTYPDQLIAKGLIYTDDDPIEVVEPELGAQWDYPEEYITVENGYVTVKGEVMSGVSGEWTIEIAAGELTAALTVYATPTR